MKELPIKELLVQIKAGNEQAVRVVYERFQCKFTETFRNRASNSGMDPLELYHDIFIKFLQHLAEDKFDIMRADTLSHWLYSTASNDLNKKYGRYIKQDAYFGEFYRRLDLARQADEQKASEELLIEIKQQIEAMKDPCRTILLLHYFEGYDQQQISDLYPDWGVNSNNSFRVKRWRCLKGVGDLLNEL